MLSRLVSVGVALAVVALPWTATAAEPKEEDVTQLALEVQALRMLASLDADTAQMKALAAMAPQTVAKRPEPRPCKATPKLRHILTLLRDALLETDSDGATFLGGKFDALHGQDDCDLNDTIEVTSAARDQTTAALRLFRTHQIAVYLNAYGDEVDPVARLMTALETGLDQKDNKDWQETRDAAADDAGWQIGGMDAEEVSKARKQAKDFLDKAHGLSKQQFEQQSEDLRKQIRDKVVGKVDPLTVMRHVMERDLAQLLSNPELPAAIKARLKSPSEEK
jgi:hypothetical protein